MLCWTFLWPDKDINPEGGLRFLLFVFILLWHDLNHSSQKQSENRIVCIAVVRHLVNCLPLSKNSSPREPVWENSRRFSAGFTASVDDVSNTQQTQNNPPPLFGATGWRWCQCNVNKTSNLRREMYMLCLACFVLHHPFLARCESTCTENLLLHSSYVKRKRRRKSGPNCADILCSSCLIRLVCPKHWGQIPQSYSWWWFSVWCKDYKLCVYDAKGIISSRWTHWNVVPGFPESMIRKLTVLVLSSNWIKKVFC